MTTEHRTLVLDSIYQLFHNCRRNGHLFMDFSEEKKQSTMQS